MTSTMSVATARILAQPEWTDGPWRDGGGPPWFVGPLLLLTWLAIIAVVIWLVARSLRRREQSSALGIVAERYARGDISSEEYEERSEQLRKRR